MKRFFLDSVILFPLVIFFIMNYRLSPLDTPYWLFLVIFVGLLGYISLDIMSLSEKRYALCKNILLGGIITLVIGSSFVSEIIVRHQSSPTYMVHDIVIQQESAIRFLIHGKNPYSVTYFGTPLEKWHYSDTEINPALYHFVMEPFYLIFALPFYFISTHTIGFFDGRIPLLFLFFMTLLIGAKLPQEQDKKRLFVTLLAFNPAMLPYIIEGRSDIFMFAFLFFSLFLMTKKRYGLSSASMAFAFAVKQSAWPLFPFYAVYFFIKTKKKEFVKNLGIFFITFGVIVAPFLLWNSKAFLDSTVYYLSGTASHSYPVSGYGLGMVLHQAGVIKDVHDYYPFTWWQLLAGIPLLFVLIKFLKERPTIQKLILSYGIFLFVYWYLSRYFNNSHLGYLSLVFITAYFWPKEEVS